MMKRLTIDSSVVIASLLKNEPRYETALVTFDDEMMKKFQTS